MPAASDDFYALLGIEATADDVTLRRAWRRLALEWHPDRAGPEATATFQKILAAYTVLSDPEARAAYDRRRGAAGRRAPAVMLRRLSGPLAALLACGIARRGNEDLIDLHLTAAEAAEGGMATISMRVPVRCTACTDVAVGVAGARLLCDRCAGTREVEELYSAWLSVRPGTVDGAILRPSVPLRGMLRPVIFRVRLTKVDG